MPVVSCRLKCIILRQAPPIQCVDSGVPRTSTCHARSFVMAGVRLENGGGNRDKRNSRVCTLHVEDPLARRWLFLATVSWDRHDAPTTRIRTPEQSSLSFSICIVDDLFP